jgi:hypothetical protein
MCSDVADIVEEEEEAEPMLSLIYSGFPKHSEMMDRPEPPMGIGKFFVINPEAGKP